MTDVFASYVVAFGLGVCTGLVMAVLFVAYHVFRFCRRIERRDVA